MERLPQRAAIGILEPAEPLDDYAALDGCDDRFDRRRFQQSRSLPVGDGDLPMPVAGRLWLVTAMMTGAGRSRW